MSKPSERIAVDVHVLEGRAQGSKTTLVSLLREVGRAGKASHFSLYCTDATTCRSLIGEYEFDYVEIPRTGSIGRLLWALPVSLWKNKAGSALWQYICSPAFWGNNYVVMHDVLPFTHPHLFDFWFRIRCQTLFILSMMLSSRIITVSSFAANEIGRLFPFLRSRIEIVRNGPSFSAEAYASPPHKIQGRSSPYVLAVGRIEPRKNIPLLESAFLSADLPDAQLVVVGRREDSKSWKPSDPRVILIEDATDAELEDLYRGASLFVFPSSAEGFGLPLLDAMLFGVPVIASSRTAMPEIGGSLVEYFDPEATSSELMLSGLIRRHFQGDPIRAITASDRVALFEKFSWETSAAALLKVLGLDLK